MKMNMKQAVTFFEARGYSRTFTPRAVLNHSARVNMRSAGFNADLRFAERGQRGRPLVSVFLCIYPIFDTKLKVRPAGLLAREFREAKAISAELPAGTTVQCGGVSTARFSAGKLIGSK